MNHVRAWCRREALNCAIFLYSYEMSAASHNFFHTNQCLLGSSSPSERGILLSPMDDFLRTLDFCDPRLITLFDWDVIFLIGFVLLTCLSIGLLMDGMFKVIVTCFFYDLLLQSYNFGIYIQ